MAITSIKDMQIVPELFSQYVADRTTELNKMVNSGIATPDTTVAQLINGTPEGGRFIQLPMWNALDGDDDTFNEEDLSVGKITTKEARATLLIRGKAWAATDLARVLGGADPMNAIIQLLADWRNTKEQQMYLAILKGLFGENGALTCHLNDISAGADNAAYISDSATLDTKQLLGDHYGSLGMVFMHSATYTYLQKNGMITRNPIFDPSQSSVEMERYLNYSIYIDDSMPYCKYATTTSGDSGALKIVADTATPTVGEIKLGEVIKGGLSGVAAGDYVKEIAPIYDTYFVGNGAFIRQSGTPAGLVETETDRDKLGGKNFLINRWCNIIHPRGLSWTNDGTYTNPLAYYPENVDLAKPSNWELIVDPKKVSLACLRHKIG